MSKIKETEKYLEKVIKELGYDISKVKLESSNMKSLGQFQLNIAMPLAKKYQKNPRDIASEIVNALDERFTNINIAGPGFINLSFTDKVLLEYANNRLWGSKCCESFACWAYEVGKYWGSFKKIS